MKKLCLQYFELNLSSSSGCSKCGINRDTNMLNKAIGWLHIAMSYLKSIKYDVIV